MGASAAVSVPPIVDATWVRTRLATDPSVVVCHVGSTMSGPHPPHDFENAHLPEARFVSLDDALAAPPSGTDGRHPLPSPAEFAAALGALGVADDATVVAYDDRSGALAGRLVWMLRILGQRAALLDGGIEAWIRGSGRVEGGAGTIVDPVERTVHDWPLAGLADAVDVAQLVHEEGVVIDSRDPARYAGDVEPIDPVAGHVPGACNLPFAENLDGTGCFHPPSELLERFTPFADDLSRAIVYCGSGVTACHNALASEHAGLGLPRVYVGSWSGWIADPERPVATGDTPWPCRT